METRFLRLRGGGPHGLETFLVEWKQTGDERFDKYQEP